MARLILIAHILTWALAPLSIFDSVAGWFIKAVNTAGDVLKQVWGAVQTVWEFLVKVSNGEWNAWDWLVNGTEWLGKNIEDWAGSVYGAIGHVLFSVIPEAVKWAYDNTIRWAAREIAKGINSLLNDLGKLRTWAIGELHKLENTAKSWVNDIIHFVTGPINWILHTAVHWVNLLMHPELLAKYLIEHIALPLIVWLIKHTPPLWVLIFKSLDALAPDILAALEDIIEKVL